MRITTVITSLGLCAATGGALAAGKMVDCYQDPRTDAMTCIDTAAVREHQGGIRSAALLTGGPNGVRPTRYFIYANCATGVVHLKDRDGVSFAGGDSGATPTVQTLKGYLCSAPLKAPKKR